MRASLVRSGVVALALVAALVAAPGLDRYTLDVATTMLVYLAATQGWNILAGYAGEASLASSAFIGAGAYTAALLSIRLGLPPLLLIAASALVGALLALLLAVPLLRVRGDYFIIASLAAALAVQALVVNVGALGGASGLNLAIDDLPSGTALFSLAAVVAAVAALASVAVRGSSFGLRLMALRDDADAAQGVGVDVFRHRLGALLLSSALISTAGAVLALQQVTVQPGSALSLGWTINILLMGVVGGLGTLLGPLVGVVVVYYGLVQQLSGTPTLGLVVEGVVLILVVLVAPRGLWPAAVGLASGTAARLGRRRL